MAVNRRELGGTIAVYLAIIVLLLLVSAFTRPIDTRYILLSGFAFSIGVSLILMTAGSVLAMFGKTRLSVFTKILLFWTVLNFLSVFLVLSGALSSGEQRYMLPLFLLLESFLMYYFGTWSVSRGFLFYGAITIKDLGRGVFLASLGLFLYGFAAGRVYSFFFVPVSIYLLITSFSPIMAESGTEWIRNTGRYLVKSGNALSSTSIAVGILLVIYEYPKPAIIDSVLLVLILLITVTVLLGVSWRIYSAASSKIKKISNQVFIKHRKNETVFSDKSLDGVMNSVNEFRLKGEKERLIITLTMILTAAGRTLDDCNMIMRSLISYRPPDPLTFKRFSIRSRVEREMVVRERILKEIMKEMKVYGVVQ